MALAPYEGRTVKGCRVSNEKFYEAVLREELPISRDFASKGWPELLYPWFLASMQLPEGDPPARKAFTLHMGDCIRSGVLPAVRQRIPWFIENEVVEPHVSAGDFSAWLAAEGKEPSPLAREWFEAQGVGGALKAESIAERNDRWLGVKEKEARNGGQRGALARATLSIAKTEGVKEATAKRGIQLAEKNRAEARGTTKGSRAETRKIDAHNVFGTVKPKVSSAR